ncbi:MAG TPA: hypothetical protein VHO46_01370 [Bacteroidales bacterium]|nr:hypothetical protein [Bacteroidales bacterium]
MSLNWQHKKYKLIRKFSSIREKDLRYRIGEEKNLIRKLRDKLGKSDEEILGIIIDL